MSSYIITSINSAPPEDQIAYREIFDSDSGTRLKKPYVSERIYRVELTFKSSGDVSNITHDELAGFLFKILEDNPLVP